MALAIAKGIDRHLKIVERATKSADEPTRLRASIWYLEHTSQHFSKSRVELTGPDGSPLAGAIAVYLPQKDKPAIEVNGNGGQKAIAERSGI
ncbi:MAG TPA: hypothetical protein VN836_12865 [Verrucomicrobiae bacterium]|nr:hypothetical protein [Verrucomicrobiae bacterium]